MGSKKVQPILVRSLCNTYRFKADFTEQFNLRDLTISYSPSADSTCDIFVNATRINHCAEYMDYVIKTKPNSDVVFKMLVNNILSETLYAMHKTFEDMVYFKRTNYVKILKRDIKNMLYDYLDCRREKLMREKFFSRVAGMNSLSRLKELMSFDSETMYYVVVPRNGLYTRNVEEMILVKSDPRNGYRNIVKRVTDAIRNNDENFNIFKKEHTIQLNKELTEDIIPFV